MKFWRPPSRLLPLALSLLLLSLVAAGGQRDLVFLSRRGGGGLALSWPALIFKALGGFIKRAFSGFKEEASFLESFEQEHGRKHVDFVEAQTLTQATNAARQSLKFLVVYIPSGVSREEKKHQAFLKTLADAAVIKAAKGSFVVWVAKANSPSARAAARELRAKKVPYLSVVHVCEKTRKMTVKNIHHFKPPPNAEQAVSWLERTMEVHGAALQEDRKEREYQLKESKLQVEQKTEFAKALQADRTRIEKEAREEAERKAREEAAKKKAAEDAARREKKKAAMGPEPTGADLVKIMVRMPDGRKIQRSFLPSDRMEKLFDWADVEGLDLDTRKIILSRPRKAFTYPEDKDSTLEAAGLAGQLLLFIEPR